MILTVVLAFCVRLWYGYVDTIYQCYLSMCTICS